MSIFATILLLGLTKAEIIERFKAPPVTQLEGLVQVYGDCDPEIRREFQLPIASFSSDICRKLYSARNIRPEKFRDAGIIIRLGDERTNVVNGVVSHTGKRENGDVYTRIRIVSPGYADIQRLRLEIVKAFARAVLKRELDDKEAVREYHNADPLARAEDIASDVRAWREKGVYSENRDDEEYMKLLRGVHVPGMATESDVNVFASRLFLYPLEYSAPFCGKYSACTFKDAISLARIDPSVRYAAYLKSTQLLVFGAGHGERMDAAVKAYANFLTELARLKLSNEELEKLLSDADAKLKGVLK